LQTESDGNSKGNQKGEKGRKVDNTGAHRSWKKLLENFKRPRRNCATA